MDIPVIAERISQKVQSKGKNPDQAAIEAKLRRLIEEFGVQPAEAERTVMNELAKEFQLTGVVSMPSDLRGLGEVLPGEWVTIEGKVVSLTTPRTPAIGQTGIIADSTGAMQFVIWAKAGAPLLQLGEWYKLESAVVDEFRNVPNVKVHSGTTVSSVTHDQPLLPMITPVQALHPGVGSVRVKMVQEWESSHERMLQTGVVGDESGTLKFTIWREEGEGKEKLLPDIVYNIYYAQVDEYNDRLSLNLNSATIIPDEGDIEIGIGGATFSGALVHISQGSGLVKRCPVEGCNRVLSRQNYCPIHEMQPEFRYDLRIKGVLDDGEKTRNVLMQREVTEQVTGMTLEAAQEMAENNPLGAEEVFYHLCNTVMGRYLICRGREMDQVMLVNQCEPQHLDQTTLAALINRAGGEEA